MEPLTNIKQMMAGNTIFVPDYQRAYSWDTGDDSEKPPKQVNTFFADLEEHNNSGSTTNYYFGHFLFEKKNEDDGKFGVIDGQQRLTTITIFLAVLFRRLECIDKLDEKEEVIYEDTIKRKSQYCFSTAGYDNLVFKDYVIDGNSEEKDSLETESAKRIVAARDYFTKRLVDKGESDLRKILNNLVNSQCTTHIVNDESEAIQMFIFQNSRGKRPSNLEIVKAQFMFNINLYADKKEREGLINDVKRRFEKIYKSISRIEYNIGEDDVLAYTLRVHFKSLTESNAIGTINRRLSEEDRISFIKQFTQSIYESFIYLEQFFCEDERKYINIHSLISFGGIGIALPFVICAYKSALQKNDLCDLCLSLESLLVRNRLIGTRADINTRLNDVFKKFAEDKPSIRPVIDRINYLKEVDDWWWGHWNNEALEKSIQGDLNRSVAKFLLWKYEIHLLSQRKKLDKGYSLTRFDHITNPELEHIAPETENSDNGYDKYDDEFRNKYINCLGNYLLLPKSHNCAIGNKPFKVKRASYTDLEQHKKIREMTEGQEVWTKEHIERRNKDIAEFITSTF